MGKKKKKVQPNRKPLQSHIAITKSYFDEFTRTAHKFMYLIGLEPSDFDILSKRTKHELILIKHTPYRIFADKESRVPRAYVKFLNHTLMQYEKQSFFGDPKFNISFLEYVTHGLTLIFAIRNYDSNQAIFLDQYIYLEKIKTHILKYTKSHEEDHYAVRTNEILKFLFTYISQPNYRYYIGNELGKTNIFKGCIENKIQIASFEPERKNFIIDGQIRPSFRLGIYPLEKIVGELRPTMVEIPMTLLESENNRNQLLHHVKANFTLPVYIQNHALRRFIERLDGTDNLYRNLVFAVSFLAPKVITALNGQRLIVATDNRGRKIGYFPFIKQDNAVLILSFLPLASPITLEGAILHKELGIQLNDSKFIGLDKISYFTKTDLDAIPQLKQALIKADMWHLTQIQPSRPIQRKEDHVLKNFLKQNNEFLEVKINEDASV